MLFHKQVANTYNWRTKCSWGMVVPDAASPVETVSSKRSKRCKQFNVFQARQLSLMYWFVLYSILWVAVKAYRRRTMLDQIQFHPLDFLFCSKCKMESICGENDFYYLLFAVFL